MRISDWSSDVCSSDLQDIEIFWHDAKAIPDPLFDTQIAAMVCGFGDSVGYETLVNRLTKGSVDKSSRFTDWSRRPLSDKQLHYALGDVTHLRTIYEVLRSEEHTSELQSIMLISYAVICLKYQKNI